MDQQQLVNVAVAERPTYSAKKHSPHYGISLVLGVFTGVFLGGCAVFFAEVGRDTVASPWELEAVSKAPVLATVPMVAQEAGRPERRSGRAAEQVSGVPGVMEGSEVRSR